MDKTQKAYQELIIGIKNYVKKCIDDYQSDKTYTGIVVATGTRLGYKIRLNGVVYDNVPTIGGTCTTNESVKLLIPNGSFSNMFILKGGVDIKDLDTQIQYVTTLTPDSDIIKNIFSNEILSDETILATLQHNIISTDSIRDAVADINDLTDDDAIIQNIYSNSILTDSTILNRLRTNILNSYYLVPFLTNLGFLTPSSQTITDLQDTDTSLGNRLTIAENNITTLSNNKVDMSYLTTNYITSTDIANTYATIAMLNVEKTRLDNLLPIAITTNNLVSNVANIDTLVATDPIIDNIKNLTVTSEKGVSNGIAELDSNGKVPASQLPSYVDDVINGYFYNDSFYSDSSHTTLIAPEDGKIYIDLDTNLTYRWSGTTYVIISSSLALGETSSTAYRGDRGKIAYDHSQLTSGNPHNVTKSDVGLGNVGNFKAVSTESNQGLSSTEQANARTNIGAGTSNFSGSYNDLSDKPTFVSSVNNKTGAVTLDKTDIGLGNVPNVATDDQTPTITESTTRTNIASGDTLKTIIGKIKKFFTDLKTVAFTGSYNDLTDKPNLADVATSGNYNDLTNKPTLGTSASKDVASSGDASSTQVVMGNDSRLTDARNANDVYAWAKASSKPSYSYSEITNKPTFATVATSGSYNDLTDKPTIPSAQVQVDWNESDSTAVDFIKNKPNIPTKTSDLTNDNNYVSDNPTFTEASSRVNITSGESFSTLFGKIKKFFSDLKTVAFTGSYNDLTDKPTIPSGQIQSDWNQTTTTEVDYIKNKPNLATVATSGSYSDLSGTPNLSTVATSGSYNDLSNKPSIPSTASDVGAIPTSLKGANNGVAELDSNGKVPSNQLPSYVDDVIEGASKSSFPTTGETGKIYVALDTNLTYRWSGTAYVEISPSLGLGETSSTAYRGDRGATSYAHSQVTSGNPHNVTKSDVGLENVGNFKAVSTVASQGLTSTEQSNAKANLGLATVATSGSYNDLSNKPTIPTVNNGTLTIKQNSVSKGTFTSNQSTASTIELTDTTYSEATQSVSGLMSSTDKTKLDGIANNANNYSLPTASASVKGGVKIGSNLSMNGDVLSATDTTYPNAYQSTDTAETTLADDDKIPFYDTSASGKRNSTWANIKSKLKAYFDTLYASVGSIPSVGNGTLTIQKNGTNVTTFTANQSTNATANITVPTKTSDLTNDSGFKTTDTTYTIGTSGTTVTLTPSSGSAQSITAPYATYSNAVYGIYTANGGQQPPSYFGKNRAGFLMSNATVAGDSHYKNWLYMDNYYGSDVGGATAFGIDRTEPRAFIMQSDANRTTWNNTAPLGVFTATPTSGQVIITDGTTGGIKSSGYTIAKSVPSNAIFTDTTYSAGTGLSLSGTTINHSNSVTAGTAGTSSATSGSTLAVPYVTYDAQGHITASGTHTHTITGFSTTDTKNTAGSTDTSSKIFLIGATSQTANSQTYSDDQCYVTNGTLTTNNLSASSNVTSTNLGVTPTNGTSGGVSLYGGSNYISNYGIAFRTTANMGKHGDIQGDWATYFTMDGTATNRGWIFRHAQGTNVASIRADGNAVFNGAVTIGGNATNTSGATMQYNSTTQAIDFIFK